MLLIFAIKNGTTRNIHGVTNICAFGDSLIFHRKNQRGADNYGLKYSSMLDINFLCKRYRCVYAICSIEECARMGISDRGIKWIIWNGNFIGDLTEPEAHRYLEENPV